jgi:uncharacterized membrane protein YagU involved in acid resistance
VLDELRNNVSWWAAVVAGFVGASVFLLANVILTPLVLDINPSLILRYMGALVLGTEVLTEGTGFTLLTGVIVHYTLSALFTVLIVAILHRWGFWVGVIGGVILGVAIYGINMYTMTVFFDWFFAVNSSVLFWSHILFGATVGGVYELLDDYDLPFGEVGHDA